MPKKNSSERRIEQFVNNFNSSCNYYKASLEAQKKNDFGKADENKKLSGYHLGVALELVIKDLLIKNEIIEESHFKTLSITDMRNLSVENKIITEDMRMRFTAYAAMRNLNAHNPESIFSPGFNIVEEALENIYQTIVSNYDLNQIKDLRNPVTLPKLKSAPNFGMDAAHNLILDPNSSHLPPGLLIFEPLLHRNEVVAEIKARFETWTGGGALVTLFGPPHSGKSTVLKHTAVAITNGHEQPSSFAVFHVDLSRSYGRPLRAFYNSLSGGGRLPSSETSGFNLAESSDESDENVLVEIDTFVEKILNIVHYRSMLVILERLPAISNKPEYLDEIKSILNSAAFNRAFVLVESENDTLGTSLFEASIPLLPFSKDVAVQFLIEKGLSEKTANDALDLLASMGYDNLFHPGYLLLGAFRYSNLETAEHSGNDVANAITGRASSIAQAVISKICRLNDFSVDDITISLAAIAIFGNFPISSEMAAEAGLAEIPRDALRRRGWFHERENGRLSDFSRSLFLALAREILSGVKDGQSQLKEAIDKLAKVLHENDSASTMVTEEAINWLGQAFREDSRPRLVSQLVERLSAYVAVEAISDEVHPFTDSEQRKLAPLYKQNGEAGDLDAGLAALALHARGVPAKQKMEVDFASNFYDAADTVATILEEGTQSITARQLIGLDMAMYFGSRRYRQFERTLDICERILQALQSKRIIFLQTAAGRRGWMSFLLNLGDLSLSVTGSESNYVELAAQIASENSGVDLKLQDYWLRARLSFLRERIATNFEEQKAALIEGHANAIRCLVLAPHDPRSVRFYLRSVRRLVQLLREDDERSEAVDTARENLERLFGPPGDWILSTRARVAALMRYELERYWSEERAKKRAKEALQLLGAGQSRGRGGIELDGLASLVEARLEAFLGNRDRALGACRRSLKLQPTPRAWLLVLRLLNNEERESESREYEQFSIDGAKKSFPDKLKKEMDRFEEFQRRTDNQSSTTLGYGQVKLWIVLRRWKFEGSIESLARSYRSKIIPQTGDVEFIDLKLNEKLQWYERMYRRRKGQLNDIEKQFGASISLAIAQFRNEAQFRRLIAVHGRKEVDVRPVFEILDDAEKRWPGSHTLKMERAEYYRYIWQTDQAIREFRHIRKSAVDGDLRRRASASLARTSLASATTLDDAEDSDPAVFKERLHEAKEITEELKGSVGVADDVAVLRDHILFELGESIDWSALDDIYDKVVGYVHGFPNTLLENFDDIGSTNDNAPSNMADALNRHYADPERLGQAGTLYLRRAEKDFGNSIEEDLRRGLTLFLAVATLDRSWHGRELPVTSFRIGRTILTAAKRVRNLNPISSFKPPSKKGEPDQLAYAVSKFQSAADRSTGDFRNLALRYQEKAEELRNSLI